MGGAAKKYIIRSLMFVNFPQFDNLIESAKTNIYDVRQEKSSMDCQSYANFIFDMFESYIKKEVHLDIEHS